MKSHSFKFVLLLTTFLQSIIVYSQSFGTPKPNTKNNQPPFIEKVYLHLDRNYYSAGDDIWFKAYLVNGRSNWPAITSRTLYVDLVSPANIVLKQIVIPVDSGIGNGDFNLPDSIPGGRYCIRAYTKWMRNFGSTFIFDRPIEIHGTQSAKNITGSSASFKNTVSVHFFPEGGELIANTESMIAFKVTDASGKGIEMKGTVISSQGDTVAWVETYYRGMGKFGFIPKKGEKYSVVGITENNQFIKADFPAVLAKGFVMRINNSDTANVEVTIATNPETFHEYKDSALFLIGQTSSILNYSMKFPLKGLQMKVKVPKSKFSGGIGCLTLYDKFFRPVSERLVYVDPLQKVKVSLIIPAEDFKPRSTVEMKIKVTDQRNQPMSANLSISVVDAGMVTKSETNIRSYLLLESEIRGKIEHPEQYFDTTNRDRYRQLDLLLMTQGWRSYVWQHMADTSYDIKYRAETGIMFSGRLRQKLVDKPLANSKMLLLMAGTGGMAYTLTDNQGKFGFGGLRFFGSQEVRITSKNDKGENKGWILLDSIYASPVKIPFKPSILADPKVLDAFASEADTRKKIIRKYSLSDTILLSDVVVKGISAKERERMNEIFNDAGMQPDYSFTVGKDDYKYYDVWAFLLSKVPEARMPSHISDSSSSKVVFRINGGEERTPIYLFNGSKLYREEMGVLDGLNMEDIEKIYLTKFIVTDGSGGYGYYVHIYTKPDFKTDLSTLKENVEGYYRSRIFYVPTGQNLSEYKDVRTTLYWLPQIKTDRHGEATVKFYNSSLKTTVRAVVEGLTDNGKIVDGSKEYNVK